MKILVYIYQKLSSGIAKFYIGALLAFIAGMFAFIQWGLPLYWERQPNFKMSFMEVSEGKYIQAEPLINEPAQCLISGTIEILNESKSPLFLNNTYFYFAPYSVARCDLKEERCISSQNTPPHSQTNGKLLVDMSHEELSTFHNHTVYPVANEHDLFSGGESWRPFSLLIPTQHIVNERMVVLAQQEWGSRGCVPLGEEKSWYQTRCNSSRALINIPDPCKM